MDLEGVSHSSPRRFKRADELGANIPHFIGANENDVTDEALDVPVPRAFYSSGLARQTLIERPLFLAKHKHVFDPDARPHRSSIRFSISEGGDEESITPTSPARLKRQTSIRRAVSINIQPDVASAIEDRVYDRSTIWGGGESPSYGDDDRQEMRREVEELRRELFPDGHAFKDRDIDYHDPDCAQTASAKVYVAEQKEEKFDGSDWPQDDFY